MRKAKTELFEVRTYAAYSFDKKSFPASIPKPLFINAGSSKVAPWGDDNLFPQNVIADLNKLAWFRTKLKELTDIAYSGGLWYGKIEYKDNGEEIFKPFKDKVIDQWLRKTNINRYLLEALTDFNYFIQAFPCLTKSNDGKLIASLAVQPAEECRWSIQESNGLIKTCFVNANWDNGGTEENSIKIPVIDPYWDPAGTLSVRTDGPHYIYPLSYPTPGSKYYQLAPWNSIRESGWMSLAMLIPKYKKALLENQMTLKYHISFSEAYWQWRYSNWHDLKEPARKQLMTDVISEFEKAMTGVDKTGKTLLTTFKVDANGNKIPGLIIEAIENKLKDGALIEDSQETSAHMLYALGLDPSITGNAPGKNMGAGSGSDKRVAFDIHISKLKATQDIILEPLYLIRDFNGWDPDIEFRFRNSIITTLDSGAQMKGAN